MLQVLLLSICIVLINSQQQQPLLTRFSIQMKNLDSQFDTDIEGFTQKILKNYELGALTSPQMIQIYKIQSPFDHQQTINKMTSDPQYQCLSLLEQFNKKKYSFSSLFINYKDGQIMQLLQKHYSKQNLFVKVIDHSVDQITFQEDHQNNLKRAEPVIETISVPLRLIKHLDIQLEKDINTLNEQQKPFVIFITFVKTNDIFQDNRFSERMLKQDQEGRPSEPIGIDGDTLSAYLISLMLLAILFIGGCCLLEIQTPMKFSKTHFVVGKEN